MSRANFDSITARDRGQVPSVELACAAARRRDRECCHVGDALLSFGLGWFRRRKPPDARGLFTARPVPWFGSTSPGFRNPPPRCGREATEPPTPRLKRRGVASEAYRVKRRKRLIGRRNSGQRSGSIRSDRFRWICNLPRTNRDTMFVVARRDRASLSQTSPRRGQAGSFRYHAALASASASAEPARRNAPHELQLGNRGGAR